jgi:hypothetical protein
MGRQTFLGQKIPGSTKLAYLSSNEVWIKKIDNLLKDKKNYLKVAKEHRLFV